MNDYKDEPWECDLCGELFEASDMLIIERDTGRDNFICEDCQEKYADACAKAMGDFKNKKPPNFKNIELPSCCLNCWNFEHFGIGDLADGWCDRFKLYTDFDAYCDDYNNCSNSID